MRCALGVLAHTGWAVSVAVAGSQLLDRRRLELVAKMAGVYHAALELPLPQAARLVGDIRSEAEANARSAIAAQLAELAKVGHSAQRCVIVGARKAAPEELELILRSHALVHAAEGDLYRSALAAGARANGLEVTTIQVGKLDLASIALRRLGEGAGPPWGRDQTLAALAALT